MAATPKKPNILFIMADDIGWFNVSAYNLGVMGYRTPNIDRIAREGALFTDFYGQQSCTAGRAAFITGQAPIRTGLTKVGMPGATLGLSAEDPSVARVPEGLRLRHRPVRQEPPRRPQRTPAYGARLRRVLRQSLSPERRRRAGVRELPEGPGVPQEVRPAGRAEVQGHATRTIATVDEQFGKVGKQTIENTGPLTRKRMETVDEEFIGCRARLHRPQDQGRTRRGSATSTRPACTSSRI